jgi:hypothetical protein
MNRFAKMSALTLVAGLALGCEARTEEVDAGGVLLTISDFDGLPLVVSASGPQIVQIESVSVENIAKNPNQPTSRLMDVEIHSYEVRFVREDTGTRQLPVLVEHVFGLAPVNGNYTLDNGPFMRPDQFNYPPLTDLRLFGRDLETNSEVVRVRVSIQFFGKTLSGDEVASAPAYFSIDLVP